MTEEDRRAVLSRYLEGELTAERAADLLGPGVAVAEVLLETRARFGRLPDRASAFAERELDRAITLLGLDPRTAA